MTAKRQDEPAAEATGLPTSLVHSDDIPRAGLEGRLEANRDQCAAIVAALDLVALNSLTFEYKLSPLGQGKVRLTGLLEAAYTQSCVVTLEPLPAEISEQVEIEFWPPEQIQTVEEAAGEEMAEIPFEGPEPLSDGAVDLGQIAYEILASSLDPYPRKEGATFDWRESETGAAEEPSGPFAALETLRKKGK